MKKESSKVARINNRYIKDTEVIKKMRIRRRIALIRRLSFFAVFLIIVGSMLAFIYTNQTLLLSKKQEEKMLKNKELASLKKEQNLLKRQIHQLHDNDYLIKLARSEYYLSKEGEIIFNTPREKNEKSN